MKSVTDLWLFSQKHQLVSITMTEDRPYHSITIAKQHSDNNENHCWMLHTTCNLHCNCEKKETLWTLRIFVQLNLDMVVSWSYLPFAGARRSRARLYYIKLDPITNNIIVILYEIISVPILPRNQSNGVARCQKVCVCGGGGGGGGGTQTRDLCTFGKEPI